LVASISHFSKWSDEIRFGNDDGHCHSRSSKTDNVTEQKAIKFITGIRRVGIFPLRPQHFPIGRRNRPIIGRLVCRVRPDEENDRRAGDAQESQCGQPEGRSTAAQHYRQNKVCADCGDQDEAEKRPSPINILDDEIPILGKTYLVREFKQMSTGRHQRERR
jgi:hypothetical protein